MHRLSRLGIEVDLPDGWDGRIYDRRDEARAAVHRGMHAATFPLPADLADFGTGAIQQMARDDVMVVLQEFADSADSALFSSQGLPAALRADAFSPNAMPQVVPGRAGAQYFFSVGDRAFSLLVVIGSHAARNQLAPVADAVVRTIAIR